MFWTRSRKALVASAAFSALAMLYVGFFQIGWTSRLACPVFGSGCESVALASFSFPLGLADGLLLAALSGVITAVAQLRSREGAAVLIVVTFCDVLVSLVLVLQMQKLGAFCFWTTLRAVLSVADAVLAVLCAAAPVSTAGSSPTSP